jgi:hypothetical protein
LKRNFEVFSACDWLAALIAHIPNIEQPEVIAKILTHLGHWPAPAHSPPIAGYPVPSAPQWVVAA